MPDRELGGYTNANALPGGGISIREESVILSPAAGTAAQIVEQTFTLPGLLLSDRIAYMTPGCSTPFQTNGTSGWSLACPPRVSAISTVSIPFLQNISAATPTASTTYTFGIAAQRLIP